MGGKYRHAHQVPGGKMAGLAIAPRARHRRLLSLLTDMAFSYGADPDLPLTEVALPLRSAICSPGTRIRLYKYQPVSQRNIDDILRNRVHMSKADSFNNALDMRAVIDPDVLRERIGEQVTVENVQQAIEYWSGHMKVAAVSAALSCIRGSFGGMKEAFVDQVLSEVRLRYDVYRSNVECACFCESPFRYCMWERYADGGKGMIAAYDIDPEDISCACAPRPCGGESAFLTLAPVEYRPDQFDLTPFAFILFGKPGLPQVLTARHFLATLHCVTTKTGKWARESEWRIFGQRPCSSQGGMYVDARASQLIAGPETRREDVAMLQKTAASLDIPLFRAAGARLYDLTWHRVETPSGARRGHGNG